MQLNNLKHVNNLAALLLRELIDQYSLESHQGQWCDLEVQEQPTD